MKHTLINLKKSIFIKIGVSNWFCARRKFFQSNILKTNTLQKIYLENEIQKCTLIIFNLFNSYDIFEKDEKEKKWLIYKELINLYNKVEFYYLLNKG